ncbi:hypothetical protein RM550_29170 [Streptomyces sp. DSM 41527]|uniref:ABC transporter permease n=1 Tax=Streptomyces mooreae TaxID=3075523 RepID=A0ABU2TFM0_9ACTN|nr:hypothetical protein [Streptomyces sp. DSM 41527]MDT0459741.1 hypothetical protein [Streptomyces sp. DSM 41527]
MTAAVSMSPVPGLPATLRAEFATWRRSAVAYLPLGGLAFSLVSIAMFVSSGPGKTWRDVLGYQNLWAMFGGPMLTALLVTTAARIDHGARGGATWYRPVHPAHRHLSRFTALAMRSLLLNVLGAGTPLLVCGLMSSAQRVPLDRAVEVIVVPWLSQLGLLALLLWLARQTSWLMALAGGFVWTVLGVVNAESASWTVLPFTWIDRGVLPVIGTHANGVALEAHSALAAASPWPPTLLGALLAVPFLLLPRLSLAGTRTAKHGMTPPRTASAHGGTARPDAAAEGTGLRPGTPRVVAAVAAMLRGTSLTWLCPGAVGLIAVWLSWHDPDTSVQLFTLLVLPIGTLVLGLVAWSAVRHGWRAVASRSTGTAGPALALTGITVGIAVAVSLVTVLLYLVAGIPVEHAWPLVLTSALVGAMLTTFTLWLGIRTSQAVAVVVGIIGILFGVLVGGTGMQQTLWLVIPYSWANYLDLPRMAVTLPVSVVATALFTFGITRAARKAAGNA